MNITFIHLISTIKKNVLIGKNRAVYIISLIKSVKTLLYEYLNKKERCFELQNLMTNSRSYEEWKHYANELDEIEGKFKWKSKKETSLYDWAKVEQLLYAVIKKREIKDIKGLIHIIRANLIRNIYSVTSPILYEISHTGTKLQIEILFDELSKSLEYIASCNELSIESKLEFFSEVRHNFGRSALLLSGGASLGMYHTGVVKVLYEQNLLPKIICGSSAGSIVASLLCTSKYEDIPKLYERGVKLTPFEYKDKNFSFLRKISRFFLKGVLFDSDLFKEFLRENIGDFTFQEAYDRTGFILNISVTGYKKHENSRLLNYLSAPNVLIWSAVAASCAVPSLFEPVELFCKNEYGTIVPYSTGSSRKFIDGSIEQDLPMQRISELFNINNFIVSQTNPYVIPFLSKGTEKEIYNKEKGSFNIWKVLKNLIFSEIKHRLTQLNEIGVLPSFVSSILKLLNQKYQGDVTIFPIPSIMDYFKTLKNPTKEMIDGCCLHAERRTYPQVNKIEGLLKIELVLEKLFFKLKHKHKKTKMINGDNKFYLNEDSEKQSKNKSSSISDVLDGIDENYFKFNFNSATKEGGEFKQIKIKSKTVEKKKAKQSDVINGIDNMRDMREKTNRYSEEYKINLNLRQDSFKIPREDEGL